MMEDQKKRVADADQKAAEAVSQIAEMKGELKKLAQKRNEFEGRLKKMESKSACWLIRLSNVDMVRSIKVEAKHFALGDVGR